MPASWIVGVDLVLETASLLVDEDGGAHGEGFGEDFWVRVRGSGGYEDRWAGGWEDGDELC